MPTTNLGRIGIVPKGTYDTSAQYYMLDALNHQDISYLVLKDVKGITPSDDGVNYMILARSGNIRGTYPTVADLAEAYPNGNSYIYAVAADQKWYYWKTGFGWVAGGLINNDATMAAINTELGGKADRSAYVQKDNALQAAINACQASGERLVLKSGQEYTITELLSITDPHAFFGSNATLINNSGTYALVIDLGLTTMRRIDFGGLRIVGGKGIRIVNAKQCVFENIAFDNVEEPIRVEAGYENMFCKIRMDSDTLLETGIVALSSDNHYTDITMVNYKKPIIATGSSTFTRVHPWIRPGDATEAELLASVFATMNGGTSRFIGCNADGYATVFDFTTFAVVMADCLATTYNSTLWSGIATSAKLFNVAAGVVPQVLLSACRFFGPASKIDVTPGAIIVLDDNSNLMPSSNVLGTLSKSFSLTPAANFTVEETECFYEKGWVHIRIVVKYVPGSPITIQGSTAIGSIPSAYRPAADRMSANGKYTINSQTSTFHGLQFKIEAAGSIRCYLPTDATTSEVYVLVETSYRVGMK